MSRRALWLWGIVGMLGLTLSIADAANCTKTKTNPLGSGTPRQPVTVSTTPIAVAAENTSRCTLLIVNISENGMACMDVTNDGTVTPATGIPIPAGASLSLDLEGQGRWLCVRTESADAIAMVAEGLP